MADVTISYQGAEIATMNATGVKTLLTGSTFCEDDIVVSYTKPSAVLQSKTVSPTTSQQTVSPDNGYDGLSSVTVNAMTSGSAKTPATTIMVTPLIDVSANGVITATVTASQSVTPTVVEGYVSQGTAGTVTASGISQLNLTKKAAQTYTPTTTAQTIAAGQFLTGVQTIQGDANLLPENIADGVTIFGVTGTHSGGAGATTVTISAGGNFSGQYIAYIDGNGNYQHADHINADNANEAATYSMLSGSLLVWCDNVNPSSSGHLSASFSGMTIVASQTIAAKMGNVWLKFYQVN